MAINHYRRYLFLAAVMSLLLITAVYCFGESASAKTERTHKDIKFKGVEYELEVVTYSYTEYDDWGDEYEVEYMRESNLYIYYDYFNKTKLASYVSMDSEYVCWLEYAGAYNGKMYFNLVGDIGMAKGVYSYKPGDTEFKLFKKNRVLQRINSGVFVLFNGRPTDVSPALAYIYDSKSKKTTKLGYLPYGSNGYCITGNTIIYGSVAANAGYNYTMKVYKMKLDGNLKKKIKTVKASRYSYSHKIREDKVEYYCKGKGINIKKAVLYYKNKLAAKSARETYKNLLSQKTITGSGGLVESFYDKFSSKKCSFQIVDLDKDKIPELVLCEQYDKRFDDYGTVIIKFKKGVAKKIVGTIGKPSKRYYKGNVIRFIYCYEDVFAAYYKISKGKAKTIAYEGYDFGAKKSVYQYRGKNISKKQFKKKIKKLGKATNFKLKKNTKKNRNAI